MRSRWAAMCAAVLVAAGCTGGDASDATVTPKRGDISMIEVTVSDTNAPSLVWPRDLEFTSVQSKVMWEGEGRRLVDGQPLLLDFFIVSLETGQVLENTFDGLPRSFLLAPEFLGDDLYELLHDQRVGTRVLSVAPAVGDFVDETPIAIVIDVLADTAAGDAQGARDDLPTVLTDDQGAPTVIIPDQLELPVELASTTLIQGHGEQIQPGSFIVAQLLVVYAKDAPADPEDPEAPLAWLAGDTRTSTWPPENAPLEAQIGVGSSLRALEEGLMNVPAGSQVMIIAPEAWAYPTEGTLIFIVDVLDVWTPESL